MPVELTSDVLARTLARLGEHDLDAPADVEGALRWITGHEDPDGAVVLSLYDLQLFLWYGLPRKWLVPLEEKRAVAARLGRFLELAGGRAAAYARVCASEQTTRLLEAWEEEDPAAGELLRDALEASGIEPPDTDALQWGSLMGLEEARLRDRIALELETAVEEGRLDPDARDFKRRRADLVTDFLDRPEADDGRTPLDVIGKERLEGWVQRGSEERRAILAVIAPLLREPSPARQPAVDEAAPAPLVWLLAAAADGITLTQTGALNRALVRAAVERFPDWWETDVFGPPHREDEVYPLCEVHDLTRRMRLLRRRGRKLVLTRRGKAAHEDRAGLLAAIAPYLLVADGLGGAVHELAAALLLAGGDTVDCDEMERAAHAAIVAEGWSADGEPPGVRDVAAAAFDLIRLADALGLVGYEYEYDRESGSARRDLTVTPAGRRALRLAMRSRAMGPARW